VNEKVEIQIGTRRLVVEIEGMTPLEINGLAQKVSERLAELQRTHKNVADTSKLALLTALSFAVDYEQESRAHATTRSLLENTADKLSQSLRESLEAGGTPAEP
jgi:cell division protein ZapA (FtsZ GTPase activity inhibitor)